VGTLTAPFGNSYTINNTGYNVFRGLVDFDYSPLSNALSFYVTISTKGFTSVSFQIASNNSSAIASYVLRYMVIDIGNFRGSVYFADVNFTNVVLNSSSSSYSQRVNPSGGNLFGNGNTPYTYCVLVMLQMVDNTNSSNFGLDMTCEPFNPAKYDVTFKLVTKATYSLIGVNIMIFDKTFIEANLSVTLEK
jgi:hypothetical protein